MVFLAALGGILPASEGKRSIPSNQLCWDHTLSTVSCSGLPSTAKWDTDILEGSLRWLRDWRISPMRKGWECWDCLAQKREDSVRISSMCINPWREGAEMTEPGSFQWCTLIEQEAMGTNWKAVSPWASGNNCLLCRWLRTGIGCSESLWSLPPWRNSKAIWTQSWATCSRCHCLSRWELD